MNIITQIIIISVICTNVSLCQNYYEVALNDIYQYDEDLRFQLARAEAGKMPLIKGAKVLLDGNLYNIALSDSNGDEIFDGNGDFLHVSTLPKNLVYPAEVVSKYVCDIQESNVISFDHKTYTVTIVDKYIPKIEIKSNKEYPLDSIDINITYGVPDIMIKEILTQKDFSLCELNTIDALIIYFWGTWCEGCNNQNKIISEYYTSNRSINIVGVNVNDKRETALQCLQLNKLNFDYNFVMNKEQLREFSISFYPTFICYKNGINYGRTSSFEQALELLE